MVASCVYCGGFAAVYFGAMAVGAVAGWAATTFATVSLAMWLWHLIVLPAVITLGPIILVDNRHRLAAAPRYLWRTLVAMIAAPMYAAYSLRLPNTAHGLERAARLGNGQCEENHRHWVMPRRIRRVQNEIIVRRLKKARVEIAPEMQALLMEPWLAREGRKIGR